MGSTSQKPPKIIFMWAWPRTTSTMLERCWMSRKDFVVEHEPLGLPWYWSWQRASPRFSEEECRQGWPHLWDETYDKVWKRIVNPPKDKHGQELRVFVKDMAKFVMKPRVHADNPHIPPTGDDGNPTFIPTADLLDPSIQHIFLIRNPEKSAPSWWRLVQPGQPTGWTGFNPEELGMPMLKELYDFIESKRAPDSPELLVVDSADLVARPEEMIKLVCEKTQTPFDPSMLSWDASVQNAFKAWPGWHLDAEHSKGIGHSPAEAQKHTFQMPQEYPQELKDAIEDGMPIYKALEPKKVRLP